LYASNKGTWIITAFIFGWIGLFACSITYAWAYLARVIKGARFLRTRQVVLQPRTDSHYDFLGALVNTPESRGISAVEFLRNPNGYNLDGTSTKPSIREPAEVERLKTIQRELDLERTK